MPTDQVADAIKKQREQLKDTQQALKETKKNMYHHLMPEWIKRTEKYGQVPFLFLVIKDATPDDLREIAAEFIKVQPGLYFLASQMAGKASYFVSISPNLSSHVSLKEFGAWLKTQGLHGGGSGTTLQGGAPQIDLDLEYAIKKWLHDTVK